MLRARVTRARLLRPQVVMPIVPAAAMLVGTGVAVVARTGAVLAPIRSEVMAGYDLDQFAWIDKQTHDDSPLNAT